LILAQPHLLVAERASITLNDAQEVPLLPGELLVTTATFRQSSKPKTDLSIWHAAHGSAESYTN